MKILDQYIIKQFLKSFFFMFLLFIPIGILVDVSEKIDKFKEHDLGFYEVFNYYLDFIWYSRPVHYGGDFCKRDMTLVSQPPRQIESDEGFCRLRGIL